MPFIRVILLSLIFAATASAGTINVAAAISLKEAATDLGKDYEAGGGSHADKVEFTFGSSGQLMAQIKAGAPIDAFISAGNKQVDDLAKAALIDPATRRVVAGNQLVLVVPADSKLAITGFRDLLQPEVRRIALGEPKTVPAGQYAAEALKSMKLGEALAPRIVYGTNVRQVLDYVERGEVDAGVVYSTDAKEAGAKVRVVATADPSTHEPIVYPGVVITGSAEAVSAKRFLDYLATDHAKAILVRHGFTDGRSSTPTPATSPAPATLRIGGAAAKPLTLSAQDLAALPHTTVHGTDHDGTEHTYSGVRLDDLLARAGTRLDARTLRGPRLADYLLVEAADGYRAVFALPELSPDFADRVVILADQCDGQPLPAKEGPFQVIVPGEKRHARWVRQVTALTLVHAPH